MFAFEGNLFNFFAHLTVTNKSYVHVVENKIAIKVMILGLDKSTEVLKKVKW